MNADKVWENLNQVSPQKFIRTVATQNRLYDLFRCKPGSIFSDFVGIYIYLYLVYGVFYV